MLASDIFFLYPAGYCGNYLQWVINKSEEATADKTVADPLLKDGTTHGFVRHPTHAGSIDILAWIIRNNQTRPQTYVVNCWDKYQGFFKNSMAANMFLNSKPGCYCVNIHATEIDEVKYGALNTYTKWPTFFAAWFYEVSFNVFGASQPVELTDRNIFFKSWRDDFPVNSTFDWKHFETGIKMTNKWYQVRNSLQPWEVSEPEYVRWDKVPEDRILDISLHSLLQEGFLETTFIPWIESKNIGTFDWTRAKEFEQAYIAAQENLQWFASIELMRQQKIVDKFLMSNSLTQCFVLEEIGIERVQTVQGWETMPTQELAKHFGYTVYAP